MRAIPQAVTAKILVASGFDACCRSLIVRDTVGVTDQSK